MLEVLAGQQRAGETVVAAITNDRKPGQVVEIVHHPDKELFVTRGILPHFSLKEVAVPQGLVLADIGEMTVVLSYLLERIATASDLNLPFRYEPTFEVKGRWFRLEDRESYMLLTRME
jgi:hypothetical protein